MIKPSWFEAVAARTAKAAGSRYAFGMAFMVIVAWALTGPMFHYSDTWQIVINTATTIVTFLMVFLLQNSTNRESKALSVKMDELILATDKARNHLVGLEQKTETEINQAAEEVKEQVQETVDARESRSKGRPRTRRAKRQRLNG